jgi:hypothetical protein
MAGPSLRNLEELGGKDSFKSIILATTMWDNIDEQTGSRREDELRNSYWKPMIELGSRLVRFHNTKESALNIIGQFTGIRQPLQLQVELVEEKKPLAETTAGLVLYRWLEASVAQLIKIIRYRSKKPSKDESEASARMVEQLEQASEQRNKLRGRQKQRRFSALTSANMIMSRSDTQSTTSSLLDPASAREGMESPPLEFHNKRLAATITALRHAKDIADAALVPDLRGVTSLALTVAESIGVNFSSTRRDTHSDHSTVNEENSRCSGRRGT